MSSDVCSWSSYLLDMVPLDLFTTLTSSKSTLGIIFFLLVIIICLLLLILLLVMFILQASREAIATYRRIEAEWEHLEELKRHVTEMFHHLYNLLFGYQFRQMIRHDVRAILENEFEEQELRREKGSNIILSGVPEMGARNLDEDVINEIIHICDDSAWPIHIFERFGFIARGQPRHIRVKLGSSYRKARILQGVPKLAQNDMYAQITITDDLTAKQQLEQQKGQWVNGRNVIVAEPGLLPNPFCEQPENPGNDDAGLPDLEHLELD